MTIRDPSPLSSHERLVGRLASIAFALTALLAVGALPASLVLLATTSWAPWWGPLVALGLAVPSTAGFLCAEAAAEALANERRIGRLALKPLPADVRNPLAQIVLAIEAIRGERSYLEGYLGDLDLHHIAWHAATTAVRAGELDAARAEIVSAEASDDRDLPSVTRAQQLFDALVGELNETAVGLCAAADSAMALSTELEVTAARARAEEARDRIAIQQIHHRARLDEAIAQATATSDVSVNSTVDLISARAAAYAEVMRIGNPPTRPGLSNE